MCELIARKRRKCAATVAIITMIFAAETARTNWFEKKLKSANASILLKTACNSLGGSINLKFSYFLTLSRVNNSLLDI